MTADRAAELARPTGSQATTFADVRAASGRRDLPAGEDDWIFREGPSEGTEVPNCIG